jgi:hypothetical protein
MDSMMKKIFVFSGCILLFTTVAVSFWYVSRPSCEEQIAKHEENKKKGGIYAPSFVAIREECRNSKAER